MPGEGPAPVRSRRPRRCGTARRRRRRRRCPAAPTTPTMVGRAQPGPTGSRSSRVTTALAAVRARPVSSHVAGCSSVLGLISRARKATPPRPTSARLSSMGTVRTRLGEPRNHGRQHQRPAAGVDPEPAATTGPGRPDRGPAPKSPAQATSETSPRPTTATLQSCLAGHLDGEQQHEQARGEPVLDVPPVDGYEREQHGAAGQHRHDLGSGEPHPRETSGRVGPHDAGHEQQSRRRRGWSLRRRGRRTSRRPGPPRRRRPSRP